MNDIHIQARLMELALAGDTDGFRVIRNELPSDGGNGTTWAGMEKKDIEAAMAKIAARVDEVGGSKIIRRRMELDVAEARLRADLMDAVDALDLSDPADARDLHDVYVGLSKNTGAAVLSKALDALDHPPDLRMRAYALYPELDPAKAAE